jgi:hypothetical protein
MAKLTDSEKLYKMSQATERQNRIAQGFFDGRFAPKSIPNKRKEHEKKISRNKVRVYEY